MDTCENFTFPHSLDVVRNNTKWTFNFRGEDPEDVGVALGVNVGNGHVHGNGMSNPSYDKDPNDNNDVNTHI